MEHSTGRGARPEGPLPLADRYRVLARVGVGGTAVVYRCLDLHTGRIVAVKVLRGNAPLIPEASQRFRHEARLAVKLAHPHIVRVLDFGYTEPPPAPTRMPWTDDGGKLVPYVAMEYVFGTTLKELIRHAAPLPLDWVWQIAEQLCSALAAAHEKGIIHRDVKPQNVLILDSRIELLAELTDFGIARSVMGDLTTLTATGQVLGTPDYLSPEQVLGEPGALASDLYALGVVLFEMITGHLPFEAETPLAAASRRMVADAPPLAAYRPDVPYPLQEVIATALRREPDDRFNSAYDFQQALQWSRAQSPEMPPGPAGGWVVERVPRPLRPRPELVPVDDGAEPGPGASEAQSTVLRVAPMPPAENVSAADATPAAPGDEADGAPRSGA